MNTWCASSPSVLAPNHLTILTLATRDIEFVTRACGHATESNNLERWQNAATNYEHVRHAPILNSFVFVSCDRTKRQHRNQISCDWWWCDALRSKIVWRTPYNRLAHTHRRIWTWSLIWRAMAQCIPHAPQYSYSFCVLFSFFVSNLS